MTITTIKIILFGIILISIALILWSMKKEKVSNLILQSRKQQEEEQKGQQEEEQKGQAYLQVTKSEFDAFYQENKDKKCEFKDFSLNQERYKKYQEAFEKEIEYQKNNPETIDQDVLTFSKNNYEPELIRKILTEIGGSTQNTIRFLKYFSNVRYISFDEFFERLKLCAYDMVRKLKSPEYQDALIILRLAYPIKKSALWVTMLIYDIIQEVVDGIEMGYRMNWKALSRIMEEPNAKYTKIVFIYPDDCIYSGSQFNTVTTEDTREKIYYVEDNILIQIYSLCPYVSDNFIKEYNQNKEKTIFPESMDRLIACNARSFFLSPRINFLKDKLFHFTAPVSIVSQLNIYFQHKLADKISLPLDMYVYGYAPDGSGGKIKVGSLINNCSFEDVVMDFQDFRKEEYRCPPSCYKKIVYYLKGKPIESSSFLAVVLKLQQYYF